MLNATTRGLLWVDCPAPRLPASQVQVSVDRMGFFDEAQVHDGFGAFVCLFDWLVGWLVVCLVVCLVWCWLFEF